MKTELPFLTIRETGEEDYNTIMAVEKRAFGYDKEARLVAELLRDTTANPLLSLLAFGDGEPVGHILFTRAVFEGNAASPLMHILAPLAVVPEFQNKGAGGRLIKTGIDLLRQRGSKAVFVLGHKEYYPKFGFVPHAARLGYNPPFPMPEENGEFWMVQLLSDGTLEPGTLSCAATLNKPQHWRDEEGDR